MERLWPPLRTQTRRFTQTPTLHYTTRIIIMVRLLRKVIKLGYRGYKMQRFCLLVLAMLLVGCVPATPPAISDIRDSMVKVQTTGDAMLPASDWPSMREITDEAERGCARYNKKPTLMSEFHKPDGYGFLTKTYLFTCD